MIGLQTFFEFLWWCISVRPNGQFWEIVDQSIRFCNFINICQLTDYTKLNGQMESWWTFAKNIFVYL